MPRRAIVALKRVAAHQVEEYGILFFDQAHHLELLWNGQRRQVLAKAFSAHRIGLLKPVPVSISVAPVVPGKLTIDVGEHADLRCARKVIRRNDLISDCGQRPGLRIVEKIPVSLLGPSAADGKRRAAHRSRSHKLPPREPNTIPARLH
jgi:hypothetical protein